MLKSFEITNFRLFQHLQVKKLSRVNLIVGKNNSGKSSFLEALELYVSNASPVVIIDQVESRQEDWSSDETNSHSQNFLDSPFRHLFFGRKLLGLREEGISVGEISSIKLRISIAAYQIQITDRDEEKLRRVEELPTQFDEVLGDYQLSLIVEDQATIRRLFPFNSSYNFRNIKQRNLRAIFDRPKTEYNWQTVPTQNISNKKLSALWDLTSLNSDLKSEVIEALRLIDTRVTGVGFVDDTSKGHDRIPLVTMTDMEEPLPLKSMGDGMMRLFHIILALVNAKNGILLIDEFENGLHWSVQPKVWDVVFQVAEKLNVQVFATTHSRDCIAGFEESWENYPDLGAFLRLDLKDGTVKATEYNSEALSDSLEMDVEMR
jgi:predicted ATPase